MTAILHFIVYLLVRFIWLIVKCIPARKAYRLGAFLGRLLYKLPHSRKRVTEENIILAGITADAAEAKRLARLSVSHFAGHVLEGLKVPEFMTAEHLATHVTVEIPVGVRALLDDPAQPILLVTPHLGCWEVGLSYVASCKPVLVLASTFNNPWIQRFSERHFRGGVEVYPKKNGFTTELMRRWGEGRALILAMDQHAGRHGIWLDFMGRPASTHTSPARLHLRTGYPIIIGAFLRTGTLHYRVVASEPITIVPSGDRKHDTVAILLEINKRFAELIKLAPEQYLWAHRRWREKPAGERKRGTKLKRGE